MPVMVERRGQVYSHKDGRRIFRVKGTLDYAEVASSIFLGTTPPAPARWGDLALVDYRITEAAYQLWDAEAIYGAAALEALNGIVTVSIDTTGATVKQTHTSLGGVQFPASPAYDLAGAIGLGLDGSIEGVERPVPQMGIDMKTRFSAAQVTDAYVAAIFNATGRINVADWRGFKAQELLFMGARIQQVNALEWDAQFSFRAQYERTNFTIASVTGINKKGWQYLWVYLKPGVQTVAGKKKLIPTPDVVRCENIFETQDFNGLAIPGATNNPTGLVFLPD